MSWRWGAPTTASISMTCAPPPGPWPPAPGTGARRQRVCQRLWVWMLLRSPTRPHRSTGMGEHATAAGPPQPELCRATTVLLRRKAVSYVRFCGAKELVSASTDSTLRLWGLGGDGKTGTQQRVFEGHLNEKNFVGLAGTGQGAHGLGSRPGGKAAGERRLA